MLMGHIKPQAMILICLQSGYNFNNDSLWNESSFLNAFVFIFL